MYRIISRLTNFKWFLGRSHEYSNKSVFTSGSDGRNSHKPWCHLFFLKFFPVDCVEYRETIQRSNLNWLHSCDGEKNLWKTVPSPDLMRKRAVEVSVWIHMAHGRECMGQGCTFFLFCLDSSGIHLGTLYSIYSWTNVDCRYMHISRIDWIYRWVPNAKLLEPSDKHVSLPNFAIYVCTYVRMSSWIFSYCSFQIESYPLHCYQS